MARQFVWLGSMKCWYTVTEIFPTKNDKMKIEMKIDEKEIEVCVMVSADWKVDEFCVNWSDRLPKTQRSFPPRLHEKATWSVKKKTYRIYMCLLQIDMVCWIFYSPTVQLFLLSLLLLLFKYTYLSEKCGK